jgi:uridine phosphorylase
MTAEGHSDAPPILEFDPDPEAMISPVRPVTTIDVPDRVVLCFFQDAIEKFIRLHPHEIVRTLRSEDLAVPLYMLETPAGKVLLVQPRVGAPLAAATMEACIGSGADKFIACGGCGVLSDLATGHLIVPTRALRDEGTSYHYAPASRWAVPDPDAIDVVCQVLDQHDLPYEAGPVWTTDAYYRETRAKVARRREEGCLAVEMECAAFCSVAAFRGVRFAQILYAGDSLAGERWDNRDWPNQTDIREKLLELAIDTCLRL